MDSFAKSLKPKKKLFYIRHPEREHLTIAVYPSGKKYFKSIKVVNGKLAKKTLGCCGEISLTEAIQIMDGKRKHDIKISEAIEKFLAHTEKTKKEATLSTYRVALNSAFKGINKNEKLSVVSPDPSSVNSGYFAAIKAFYGFCMAMGFISSNPYAMVPIPGNDAKKTAYRVLSNKEISLILDSKDISVEAIFCKLAILTGLRKSEILKFKKDDFDADTKTLRVFESKTGFKIVPLTKDAVEFLEKTPDVFFSGLSAATPHAIHKYLKYIGILNAYNIHDFRRTYATNLMATGVSVIDVMHGLNHKNITSSIRYLKRDFETSSRNISEKNLYKK